MLLSLEKKVDNVTKEIFSIYSSLFIDDRFMLPAGSQFIQFFS